MTSEGEKSIDGAFQSLSLARTNPVADFGSLMYPPRLRLVFRKAFEHFAESGFLQRPGFRSDKESDYADYFAKINDFTIITLTRVIDIVGNREDARQELTPNFTAKISNKEFPSFVLLEETYNTYDYAKNPDEICENFFSLTAKKLGSFLNLRAVLLCFCCSQTVSKEGEHCDSCLPLLSFNSTLCLICKSEHRDVAVWMETPCKHIFHSDCILSRALEDDDIRCPSCNTKFWTCSLKNL